MFLVPLVHPFFLLRLHSNTTMRLVALPLALLVAVPLLFVLFFFFLKGHMYSTSSTVPSVRTHSC